MKQEITKKIIASVKIKYDAEHRDQIVEVQNSGVYCRHGRLQVLHFALLLNLDKLRLTFYSYFTTMLAIILDVEDNGKLGLRPHYHEDYYGAFVLDRDCHNIEVICHNKR